VTATTAIAASVERCSAAIARMSTRSRATTAPRRPRIALVGSLTAGAAPGGGEVQLRSLASWLPGAGIQASLWRPWEHDWSQLDALHLVGSQPEFLPLAAAARKAGKPVFLSPVAWFTCRDLWREPWSITKRLWACGKFAARALCPQLPSWRRELYHAVDLLLPNSRAEAVQLARHFSVPSAKLRVVPNGVDAQFAHATPEHFERTTGWRDFVLCVGRIEPRKNQLRLLEALRGTGVPVVLIGNVVPGHEGYLEACRRAAGDRALFLGHVDHSDPLLASAYAACRCLALVSWYETPGLAALEAALTGTPLVLTADGACQEYFGQDARYVSPGDPSAIRAAVLAAMNSPRSAQLAELVQQQFTGRAVAQATKEAYETLL
jgi:glycosyltransferase involved in cell wall biosynthesis